MSRVRHLGTLVTAAAIMLAIAGCSQIAAIAPVGGDHLAEVRFAANDLLLQADIELLTAPACTTASDGAITCEGETLDGEKITVESPADDPQSLTVTVGSDTLYSGSIQEALEKPLRPAS
jgi:hypothetical protein